MAQQLQNITIAAPAFKGLNTEDSPLNADPSFAATADNCVIDKYGRIGARKGLEVSTVDNSPLGGLDLRIIHVFEDSQGNEVIFSAGNNKIFKGTELTDVTPAGATITADNWHVVNFNQHCYFFQKGHDPLCYSEDLAAVVLLENHPFASGTPPQCDAALAAYGRLWITGGNDNNNVVYWSDLLNGAAWNTGTSGYIDLSKVWPDGHDNAVTMAAHNGYLIIFGSNSILVYNGAEDPSTMELSDTVNGIGCVARDTVQHTGGDVIFLSHVGVHTFGRVLQQKSMPMRNMSKNIRNDLLRTIKAETLPLTSVYSPENSFYLLLLRDTEMVYCFDTREMLEDGSSKVTRWIQCPYKCFANKEDGTVLTGGSFGIGMYSGYTDNGENYLFRYFSNPLTFGDSSRTKFLKKIIPTVIGGGNTTVNIKWAYDYSDNFSAAAIYLSSATGSEYNIAEYNIGEYSSSTVTITKKGVQASGSGAVVTVGVEAEIQGQFFSLQEFNIQALLGRLI